MDNDDVRLVTSQQNYQEVIDNAVQYVSAFMKIKGLNNISNVKDNEGIRNYIPEGQDLVLGDFSEAADSEYFLSVCNIITSLILMQKKYYVQTNGMMLKGVIPAIEAYTSRLQYFVIKTRASGDERERKLHTQKGLMNSPDKRNFVDRTFGPNNK